MSRRRGHGYGFKQWPPRGMLATAPFHVNVNLPPEEPPDPPPDDILEGMEADWAVRAFLPYITSKFDFNNAAEVTDNLHPIAVSFQRISQVLDSAIGACMQITTPAFTVDAQDQGWVVPMKAGAPNDAFGAGQAWWWQMAINVNAARLVNPRPGADIAYKFAIFANSPSSNNISLVMTDTGYQGIPWFYGHDYEFPNGRPWYDVGSPTPAYTDWMPGWDKGPTFTTPETRYCVHPAFPGGGLLPDLSVGCPRFNPLDWVWYMGRVFVNAFGSGGVNASAGNNFDMWRARWRDTKWTLIKKRRNFAIGAPPPGKTGFDRTWLTTFETHYRYPPGCATTFNEIVKVVANQGTLDNPFSVTNGSAVVTVSQTGHNLVVNQLVQFRSNVTNGGNHTPVGGCQFERFTFYPVSSVIDANTYTVVAPQVASSTVSGGGGTVWFEHAPRRDGSSYPIGTTQVKVSRLPDDFSGGIRTGCEITIYSLNEPAKSQRYTVTVGDTDLQSGGTLQFTPGIPEAIPFDPTYSDAIVVHVQKDPNGVPNDAWVRYARVLLATGEPPLPGTYGGAVNSYFNNAANEVKDMGLYTCPLGEAAGHFDCRAISDFGGLIHYPREDWFVFPAGGGHASSNQDAIARMRCSDAVPTFTEMYSPTPVSLLIPSNLDQTKGAWISGPSGPYPRPVSRHTIGAVCVLGDELIQLGFVEGNAGPGFSNQPVWDWARFFPCTVTDSTVTGVPAVARYPASLFVFPEGRTIYFTTFTGGSLAAPIVNSSHLYNVGSLTPYYVRNPVDVGNGHVDMNFSATPLGPLISTTGPSTSVGMSVSGEYASYELVNALSAEFGGSSRTAHFNLRTQGWSFAANAGNVGGYGAVSPEPLIGKVLCLNGNAQGFQLYDAATKEFTSIPRSVVDMVGTPITFDGSVNGHMRRCPLDLHHYFFSIEGGDKTYRIELDRDNLTVIVRKLNVTGTIPGPSQHVGMDWDTKNKLFVGRLNNNKVYGFDPITFNWTERTVTGGSPGSMVFNSWAYSPKQNIHVFTTGFFENYRQWCYRWG